LDVKPDGDELRPVTALFADIVGSTRLGERLKPEEVKALIGECVSRMSATAEAFGGFVQAYQGDGICVFFGVPSAHEDDPERAAGAALEIISVADEYAHEIAAAWGIQHFSVRVGVNTGSAAVGLVGAEAPHPVALGDVTNTAARLQSAAQPGTVLVGADTAKRLSSDFQLESAGQLVMKGKNAPVDAWRLVGLRMGERTPAEAPLVGRESELEWLHGVLEEVQRGRGQILVVLGPAGIGKTRIVEELRYDRAPANVAWLYGRARPYGAAVGYAALIDALRNWLEVGAADPPIVVRTRLLSRGADLLSDDSVAALSAVLGLTTATTTQARVALLTWIDTLASRRPLALVLDDMQWADPATRDVIEEALTITERLPLLLILCMRPDASSEGWALRVRVLADYAHRSAEVFLGPLGDASAQELAQALNPAAADAIRAEIVEEAEGNPLYLQELVRAAAEDGTERHRSWTLTALPAAGLPSSLESLLIARLDRLPINARWLAQSAAVLGKTFQVALLEAMVNDEEFHENLQTLLRAEVVRETRRVPSFECTFTHGLLLEASLLTLPQARRRELYAAAATAIEQQPG
jgi:class 3 adenylate cyclase